MEKFSYETNGYNRDEVNKFLGDIINQTEGIINKCRSQSEEIEKLKFELEYYKSIESRLRESILKAEKTSDNIREVARNERDTIINEAKENASIIVNEALLRAQKIENETQILEHNMKIFKDKLKLLVQQQMDIVEEIEILELEP